MIAASLPHNRILVGDVRERLLELPDTSVDCIITSPPYFGLRDYGHPAQLGLESNVEVWVENLRMVCRELARILKPTGSLWLNVADSYSSHRREGGSPKSLLLGPQRLALALAEDGWIVRNQIIWHKPNAMPSSIRDRLACTYEVAYLLVRSKRYFFDLDGIRVPGKSDKRKRGEHYGGYPPDYALPRGGQINRNNGLGKKHIHPLGKNPGDVWSMGTAGFRGAHFATFPLRLIERPLLAACPERVCVKCGRPWQRTVISQSGTLAVPGELRPSCTCTGAVRPGVVLDPFIGSGTVAVAAEMYGREWVGIELNQEYAAMAERRLEAWRQQQAIMKTDPPASDRDVRPPPVRQVA